MGKKEFIDFLVELMDTEDDLTLETKLEDVEEWDSLSYVAFLAAAAKFVSGRIEPQEVKQAKTVNDLYKLLK